MLKTLFAILVLFSVSNAFATESCDQARVRNSQGVGLSDGSTQEEQDYRRAIELCPELLEAHYNLAVNLQRQEKFDDSLSVIDSALRKKKLAALYVLRGNILWQLEREIEAERAYLNASEEDKEFADAYCGLAAVYIKRKDFVKAEQISDKGLRKIPTDSCLLFNAGLVSLHIGKYHDAVRNFSRAFRTDENFTLAELYLAKAHYMAADRRSSVRIVKNFRTKWPSDSEELRVLGELYDLFADHNRAVKAFEDALRIDPTNWEIMRNLAVSRLRAGEVDLARQQIEKAGKLKANESSVQGVEGWISLIEGDFERAEKELLAAIDLDKSNALAHYNLGVLFRHRGAIEDADRAFARAYQIDPSLGRNNSRAEDTQSNGNSNEH